MKILIIDSTIHIIKLISCILNRVYFALQFIRTYILVYYKYVKEYEQISYWKLFPILRKQ